MKRYIKDNVILNESDIIIKTIIDGVEYDTYNPSVEMILEDGWVEWHPEAPEITPEQKLDINKRTKIDEIISYDSSDEINSFKIYDTTMWLDKATRAGLMLRFNSEKAIKKETTTLWYNDICFEIPLQKAIHLLYALEIYASECYDNTQKHISNINAMTSPEEVSAYDYKTGYPEKLIFTI